MSRPACGIPAPMLTRPSGLTRSAALAEPSGALSWLTAPGGEFVGGHRVIGQFVGRQRLVGQNGGCHRMIGKLGGRHGLIGELGDGRTERGGVGRQARQHQERNGGNESSGFHRLICSEFTGSRTKRPSPQPCHFRGPERACMAAFGECPVSWTVVHWLINARQVEVFVYGLRRR